MEGKNQISIYNSSLKIDDEAYDPSLSCCCLLLHFDPKIAKKSQTSKLQDPMHELVATIRMSENVFLIVCSITNYISIQLIYKI